MSKIELRKPKRKQPVWKVVKPIVKLFFNAKVRIIADEVPEKSIIAAIHSAKRGPMVYECNYPRFHATWGAYQMMGNYKSRFNYLRNVLYIQKMHKNKFSATLKAAFEALFSIYFYRGIKVLPTYQDNRLKSTLQVSMEALDQNMSVMVFPEDSNKGYFNEMTAAFPGFVMLAEQYYKRTGEDLPIMPVHYQRKTGELLIGHPLYIQELKASVEGGLNKQQVADIFKDEINALYRKYILGDKTAVLRGEIRAARIKEEKEAQTTDEN
jgi:hypothetical protein